MKALYALYSDPDAAQRAVNSLKLSGGSLGIGERQIVVVRSEPFDGYDFSDEHSQTRIFLIASLGGICGALLGLLFVRFTQFVYPLPTGGMPIAPHWTNGIITYETTMLGAILTTVVTLLVTAQPAALRPAPLRSRKSGTARSSSASPIRPKRRVPSWKSSCALAGAAQVKTI